MYTHTNAIELNFSKREREEQQVKLSQHFFMKFFKLVLLTQRTMEKENFIVQKHNKRQNKKKKKIVKVFFLTLHDLCRKIL